MKKNAHVMPGFVFALLASSLGVATPAAAEQVLVEEIIVTARQRAESLQEMPVTVTAFTKDQLDLYNIDSLENISEFTPGLLVSDAGSASGGTIAMRGVATGQGNTSFDQTVAVVFDNVAVNHAYIMKVSQIDMQQVEVLKGPQALFFGKNSPGGVIAFQTVDPGDEFEMSLRTGFEVHADELFGEATVSGPITDTLGGRLVVYGSDMDGWVENAATPTAVTEPGNDPFPNREELFVRGTLVFEPSDTLRMRTKVSYNDYDGDDTAQVQLVSCPGGFEPAGSPCGADDVGNQQLIVPELVAATDDVPDRNERTQVDWLVIGHEINFQINDDLQLSSVTGYTNSQNLGYGDALSGQPAGLIAVTDIEHENFSQELRLSSSFDGGMNFMLGAYYGDGGTDSIQQPFLHGPPIGLPATLVIRLGAVDPVFSVDHETYSVFGELTWDISEQLVLSAGLRYSDESRDFSVNEGGVDYSDRVVRERDNDNTSPEVSLTWKPTDTSTYFISYREGFKSGGFNSVFRSGGYQSVPPGSPLVDQSYNPETVEGVEGGFKLDLLDNHLRLNASAFYYEYTDMQLSAFDSTALVQRVLNAGEATIQGAEFDLLFAPESIEGLSLSLGAAYTDAEFDTFSGQCYVGQTPATGCVTVDVGLPSQRNEQNLAGRATNYAPEFTLNAGARYNTQLSDNWSLGAAVSVLYSDSYVYTATYGPTESQDSFTKVNANLTLGYQDNWEFSLIGNNLTDEYTAGGGGNAVFAPPFHTAAVVSRGQQIILQATWRH